METQLLYQIALTLLPGIGPVKAKLLLSYCGSAEAVFRENKRSLLKIPEIGPVLANGIITASLLERAEQEIEYMIKNNIHALFFTDRNYPDRLKQCDDGPVMLFTKGLVELNVPRSVSIVGTRNCTSYGRDFCDALVKVLQSYDPLIVSGLAYGIDISAHKAAMNHKLKTVACLAHGLNKIYPAEHRDTAREMLAHGGLVTEFLSYTNQTAEQFPMRNRIIAGLSDCVIVVESGEKGGSIITAHIANSYGRDVYALPGRHNDKMSIGCNELIRRNIAGIITSPEDIIVYMGWKKEKQGAVVQLPLFADLSKDESLVIETLRRSGKSTLDSLSIEIKKPIPALSALLLEMEFKGLIRSLPGKVFETPG